MCNWGNDVILNVPVSAENSYNGKEHWRDFGINSCIAPLVKALLDAGYEVILVGSKIGVENYHPPSDVYGVIANPVCREFSAALKDNGKWKPKIGANFTKGLFLVKECQRVISECDPKFWVIENPATGRLKEYLGQPDYVYEPWQFGSPWTKKTALWGLFNKPEPSYKSWEDVPKIKELYKRPNRPKPSMAFLHKSAIQYIPEFSAFEVDSDMEFRSLCSQKFAQAFFEANKYENSAHN